MEQTIKTPKKKHGLTTTRIIALGFAGAILVGSLLLMLPVSSADGNWTKPIDALFTATTSICVTGLVTVTTAVHWSFFGQVVILILAQLGGLGVITAAMCIMLLLRKKITLKDRMLIQETYNMDTLSGLVRLVIKIVKGTFLVEGVGAILYCFVLIPEFGFWPGLWKSVFNARLCGKSADEHHDHAAHRSRRPRLCGLVEPYRCMEGAEEAWPYAASSDPSYQAGSDHDRRADLRRRTVFLLI